MAHTDREKIIEKLEKAAISWDRSFEGKDGWTVPTEINGELVQRFKKIK